MKKLLSCALSAAFFFSATPLQADDGTTNIFETEVFGRTVIFNLNNRLPPHRYDLVIQDTLIDVQGVRWFGWDRGREYVATYESSSPKRTKRRWRAASPSCNGVSSVLCPSSKAHLPVVLRFTGGSQQTAVEVGLGPEGLQAEKFQITTNARIVANMRDGATGLTTLASARQVTESEIVAPAAEETLSFMGWGLGTTAPVLRMDYLWADGTLGRNFFSCPMALNTGLPRDLLACDRFGESSEPTDVLVTPNYDGLLWASGGGLYFNAIKQDGLLSDSKYAVTFDGVAPTAVDYIIRMFGYDSLLIVASSTTGQMHQCSYPMHTAAGVLTPMACEELAVDYAQGPLVGMIHPAFETRDTFVTAVGKTLIECNSTADFAYTCRNIATLDTEITALSALIGQSVDFTVQGLTERFNFIVGLETASPTYNSNVVACSVFGDVEAYASQSVCHSAFLPEGMGGAVNTGRVAQLAAY